MGRSERSKAGKKGKARRGRKSTQLDHNTTRAAFGEQSTLPKTSQRLLS